MNNIKVTACRGIVLPDAENRTIVSSFVCTKYRSVTEGQRTDGNGLASTVLLLTKKLG